MRRTSVRTAALVLAAAYLMSHSSAAAQGGLQWISTDGSPPGAPPEIRYDADASNARESVFLITIHGFYIEPFVGPDQRTYHRIHLPQHREQIQQVGAPELPAVQMLLALPGGIDQARLGQLELDIWTLDPILVAPEFTVGLDGPAGQDPPPREPEFALDEEIYFGAGLWPATNGTEVALSRPLLGSIDGVQMTVYPMRWDPQAQQLQVWRQARVQISHLGSPQYAAPITKERWALASSALHNWPAMERYYPWNPIEYEADYLFIYPEGYREELLPLIDQKWARGFYVTEEQIGLSSESCSSIQTIIATWYEESPENRDKYCLLVGDSNVIPMCTSPGLGGDYPSGVPSDDPYASVNGADLDEEVWLGRLSVDGEADCANQVAKILDYEDSPLTFGNYDEVLLVAHSEGAPGKYVGAHESVRTATYALPPTFTTLYGNNGTVSDTDVSDEIDAGLGLVAYRGHGNSGAWTGWNSFGQDYNQADLVGLANTPQPVVWSFACTNQDLQVSDCMGEIWMELAEAGAVSHYGATVASYTDQNHELDRRMFKGVYDWHLTTQSHAIWYAELYMNVVVGPENAWMYLLLGDPDMQIRRRPPLQLVVDAPPTTGLCTQPPCDVTMTVLDLQGQPVPEALVAIYKPEGSGGGQATDGSGGAEVFANRYTDANGQVTIPASPSTTGDIRYSVQDEDGNLALGTIEVIEGSVDVGAGSGATLAFRAIPSITRGATLLSFGRVLSEPATVVLHDVSGRAIRRLEAGSGSGGIAWDGRDDSGRPVTSGLYFARFSSGAQAAGARVTVMR